MLACELTTDQTNREDVERYLARTPDFWTRHGRDSVHSKPSQEITCRTPPPSSPRATPISIVPISVPPKLDAAQEVHMYEEIIRLVRVHTEGSFEQQLWHLSPVHKRYYGAGGPEANARFNAWYDKMRNVSDWPGRDADAVRLVNYLLDDLPQFIRDQDFTFFPALMRCCFYLSARRPALGRAVVQFVARLCTILLGEKHPMTLAWSRIRSLPTSDYLLVLQGTAKVRLDQLEARNTDGIQDENTVNALREYLLVLRLRGSAAADELDRVTRSVTEQIPRTEKTLPASHCRLLLGTATSYLSCGRFGDAEEMLDRVGAHFQTSPTEDTELQRIFPTYLFIMGFLRYATLRMDEAVNYFLRTYYVLEKARGANSSAVADILLALIDFPGLLQKPEEIAHWKGKLEEVQAEILTRAQKGIRHTASELLGVWDGPLDTDVNTGKW